MSNSNKNTSGWFERQGDTPHTSALQYFLCLPKSCHFTKPGFCFLSATINSFFTCSLYSQQTKQNKTSHLHYTRPHHLENHLASSYSQQQQATANQSKIQAKDSKFSSCHIASMVPHHEQQMNAYRGRKFVASGCWSQYQQAVWWFSRFKVFVMPPKADLAACLGFQHTTVLGKVVCCFCTTWYSP
jgi:hypothetical protein